MKFVPLFVKKCFPLLLMLLVVPVFSQVPEPCASPTPQVLSTSPDGKFLVRREQAESGEYGEAQKRIEVCSTSGKVLYAWISALGSTTLLWSPDSRYLAANDMPGVKGDQLHILFFDPRQELVTSVREPDGEKLLKEEEARHGTFLTSVESVNLRASEWKEGRLWTLLTGRSHPKRQPMVHVGFHHLRVYDMKEAEAPELHEEWTLTDPKERAVRDPAP